MTSPYVTKHVISLELSDTNLLWFKIFAFEKSLLQKFFLKLKHCFMNFALYVKRIIWNVVRRPSFSGKNFKVKKFTTNRRFNVSETDDLLSTEISLKYALVFFRDGSHRLAHPISQINSVFFRVQFCLSTDILFELRDGSVWIEDFFNDGILRNLLEFRL